jgi:hypothetical protein
MTSDERQFLSDYERDDLDTKAQLSGLDAAIEKLRKKRQQPANDNEISY